MAIYTTFFVCEPAALQSAFPTWKPPLPRPVSRQFRDPFSGKMVTRESDAPEWPDSPDPDNRAPTGVAVRQGDYAKHLEDRLPAAIRAFPHWSAKGLTEIELEPLAASFKVEPLLQIALYAPPSTDALLFRFDRRARDALASLGAAQLHALAKQWSVAMSDDAHTRVGNGTRLSGLAAEQAAEYLRQLGALAKKAGKAGQLFLLVEP